MVKSTGRSKNLLRNVTVSWITQIIVLTVSFANRTIYIQLLGAEYLGIDGLFSSILNVFSLAELGIGSAIIYNLYKPIACGDTEKARQYLTFYSKAYTTIIIVIGSVGMVLLPFLNYIVRTDSLKVSINIYGVYLLFLANTISSYFLAHRQATLVINQQQSTVSAVQMSVKILALTIESVVLLISKNYYLFLAVKVVCNYIQSLIIDFFARKKYPELSQKSSVQLSKTEISTIKKNVWALFIRRVGSVVLVSTDNIIINSYISTGMVGIYSNYTLIVTSIQMITTQMFTAMTATVGNYVASKSKKEVEQLFETYTYTIFLVYGFCSICLYTLTNRFILLLWGESYLLSETTLFIIVINYFLYGFQVAINNFRDTTGLFVQGKYRALFSATVNVVLSLLLVRYFGVSGVILGTVLSRITVSTWYDPYIMYKHYFEKHAFKYFLRLALYTCIIILACFVSSFACSFFPNSLPYLFFSAFVACAISIVILCVPFMKTKEFSTIISYAKYYINMVRIRITKISE